MRHTFNKVIYSSIKKGQSLDQVISVLAETLKATQRLESEFDLNYVEDKYTELLVEEWLREAPPHFTRCFVSSSETCIDLSVIPEVMEAVNTTNTLEHCYRLTDTCMYTHMLEQLGTTSKHLRDKEKQIIDMFKRNCHDKIVRQASYAENELNFCKCFVEAMKYAEDLNELFNELNVHIIKNDSFSLREFLINIQEKQFQEKTLKNLQHAAKMILQQDNYFFLTILKETLNDFLKPPVMSKRYVDGRELLEVSGRHIVVSKMLPEIEEQLKLSKIEEVRFVEADAIHVNANLEVSIWHGTNIVLFGRKDEPVLIVVKKDRIITWDVSGKDAECNISTENAGSAEDGTGLPGADGSSGESGGNVLIMAMNVENANNLQIISNGGNGSNGQDGGPGLDGKDGYYPTHKYFKENFPPVSSFWNSTKTSGLETTKRSILGSLQCVKNVYVGPTELGPISKCEFENMFDRHLLQLYDTYFEVSTITGCKIYFSFYCEGIFTFCQSLLLYKGALGEDGKHGVTGGSGGRGGFPGDIDIQVTKSQPFEIIKVAENGCGGRLGNCGKMGEPGKRGLDRGYLDHSLSTNFPKVISPKYESPLSNKLLAIEYYPESTSERVFCPHNQLYAEITEAKEELKRSRLNFDDRKHVREENTRQEVEVIRKKTICKESLMERYKSITSIFNDYDLFSSLRALQEMPYTDITLKTEQVTELKVSRHINYFSHDTCLSESSAVEVEDGEEVIAPFLSQCLTQEIIELVNKDPSNKYYWDSLSQIMMDLPQLQNLWLTANVSSLPSSAELDTVLQAVFCDKYQLAVLQHLEAIGSEHPNHSTSSMVSSKIKCFPVVNVDHFIINYEKQETFGTVEDFFCKDSSEKREEIIEICKGQVLQTLRESVKILIREYGQSCGAESILNVLYRESVDFKKCNDKIMKQITTPLRNMLLSANNQKDIYSMLVESITEQNTQKCIQFVEEIAEDKFIKKLYEMYAKEVQRVYEWDSHLRGKVENIKNFSENQIKMQMYKYIKEKGPLSAFCREFLAHYFKTNIKVYALNENSEILLVSNHNPRAERAVHIFLKDSVFVKLNISHDFVRMIEHHIKQGMLYNKILAHTDSCATKQQLDDIFSKNPFRIDSYEGTDKSTEIKVKMTHILNEECNLRLITNTYKTNKDKSLIASRLDKLKLEYIDNDNILHYMALHFRCEGKHISAKELCFVINYVLKSATDAPWTMPLVSWIIASNPQTLWLRELTLLKLELKFKRMLTPEQKEKWREYMADQNEKAALMLFIEKFSEELNNVSMKYVDELLYLLSCIPRAHIGLDKLDLSEWKFCLKDRHWACQVKATADWSEEQLKLASFHLATLENSVGIENCEKIVQLIRYHSHEIESEAKKICVLNTLKGLLNKEICISEKLLELLSGNSVEEWPQLVKKECFDEERSLSQLCELIRNSGNTSKNTLNKLNDVEQATKQCIIMMNILIMEVKEESQLIKWISGLLQVLKEDKTTFIESLKSYTMQMSASDDEVFNGLLGKVLKPFVNMQMYVENEHKMNINPANVLNNLAENLSPTNVLLATIGTAVHLKFNIHLRNTQLLTILMFVNNCKNILGQVATGEGKSLIVVCIAIMKALFDKKVDIITSSHVLARRDARVYKDVYEFFELNVSHNCSETKEERQKAYSNCQVVYGELANFQRDYLLDRFYGENIVGDRTFDTIIVDEVDNMLLDRGNNMLYLSHDIPGLDKLEPVFLFIWKSLKIPNEAVFVIEELHQRLIYEIFGRITRDSLRILDVSFSEKHINNTWEYLVSEKVINNRGDVLIQHIDEDHNWSERCAHRQHLTYLLKKVIEREKQFEVPKYIRSFVEYHLKQWITSAMKAMSMECGVDYVVDVVRSGASCDRNPNITILDNDTGTDLSSSQWDEALHQFLQLKHGCKISLISLKAVYKSNVSYLKLYQSILGLTGTLGSKRERKLLKDVYKVDFVTVPTAKSKALTEEISIVCSSIRKWANTVSETVILKITKNRSVLIICETINKALYLKARLNSLLMEKKLVDQTTVSTYTRDYEELDVAKDLKPMHIIISTNLAGRGTDLKLSRELVDAGGLHVCLTFLPNNIRIEEQAFGRAARNGEPGSAQLIFSNSSPHRTTNIIDLKKQRDLTELLRIKGVKKYYESNTLPEEKLFEDFSKIYWSLSTKLKHSENVKSILLQYCLDQWAFWLDENFKIIDTVSGKHFFDSLLELHHEDLNIWSKQIKNPFQLIKLGLEYLKEKKHEYAFSLFNQVIEEEPSFAEAAYYYRVCVKAAIEDIQAEKILSDLEFVGKVLKDRVQLSLFSAQLITVLKDRNPSILQIDAFKEQQFRTSSIYSVFLQSIYNILGKELTDQSFVTPTEIDEKTSFAFYNDLIENNVLVFKVNTDCEYTGLEKELAFVVNYGVSCKEVLSIVKKYVTKFDKIQLLKDLKKQLPSRECFWEELVSSGVLRNEKKLAFVDCNKLSSVHSLLPSIIQPLGSDIQIDNTNSILMHQPEEKVKWLVCHRDRLKRKIGKLMFKFLKEKKIICLNKQATVSHLYENVRFSHFDSVSKKDFNKVGISDAVATTIVNELKEKRIIKEEPLESESTYKLMVSAENISEIELETCKAYTDDVKSVLTVCFAFRGAYDKFSYLVRSQAVDCNYPCLHLPSRLHKQVLNELHGKGIIKLAVVNPDADGMKVLEKLYPTSMSIGSYVKLFSDCFENLKTRMDLIKELIDKEWLVKAADSNRLTTKYCINTDEQHTLKKPKALDNSFSNENMTIDLILSSHVNFIKVLSQKNNIIKSILERSKNTYHRVETPSFTLTPLLSVLQQQDLATTEAATFSLNGFDQLICLSEKTWSWRMKRNLFFLTALALAELAVGAALEVLCFGNPLGLLFVAEGVNDLCYVLGSVFSGYCTLKDFAVSKLISLVVNIGLNAATITTKIFSSKFGKQLPTFSPSSNIEKCSSFINKIKTRFSNFWSVTPSEASKSEVIKSVVKHVAIRSTQGLALAVSCASIDHVIQPQLENLGKSIIDVIYSDIDNTVDNHHIDVCLKELYRQYGNAGSKMIVNVCMSIIIEEYKKTYDIDWPRIVSMMNSLIDCAVSQLFQQSDMDSHTSLCMNVYKILSNIVELVNKSHTFYKQITTLVDSVLDNLERKLQEKLDQEQQCRNVREDELERFCAKTLDSCKKIFKSELSSHINEKIIFPVLCFVENNIFIYSSQIILNKSDSYFADRASGDWEKFRKPSWENKEKSSTCLLQKPTFVDTEYEMCLLEMLRKRRSAQLFITALKENTSVDMNFIEMFCHIIPKALRREGIVIPGLEVIVERDGVQQRFCTTDAELNVPSVIIIPEADLTTNLKKNTVLIKQLFDNLCSGIVQHNPDLYGLGAEAVRLLITNVIECDLDMQRSLDSNKNIKLKSKHTNHISSSLENKTLYQHSDSDGNWSFSQFVESDLGEKQHFSCLEDVSDHILEGFKAALEKVNRHIYKIQTYLKLPFKLVLDNLCKVKYEIAPLKNKESRRLFHCFASQYDLVIPLKLEGVDHLVDFRITLTLKNQLSKAQLSEGCPQGPHIIYEVNPINSVRHLPKGIKGHVLLNAEHVEDYNYTAADCYVAGELIVPTQYKL